ncbi:MAG: hypothetical protein AAGA62_19245, partial [Bacteroidota bacterium]
FQQWVNHLGQKAGAGAQVQRKVLVRGQQDGVSCRVVLDYVIQAEPKTVILIQDVHQVCKLLEQQLSVMAAQLRLGATLLTQSNSSKVVGLYLHLPVTGTTITVPFTPE